MFATCATGVAIAPVVSTDAKDAHVFIKMNDSATVRALPFPMSIEEAAKISVQLPATTTLVEEDADIAEGDEEGETGAAGDDDDAQEEAADDNDDDEEAAPKKKAAAQKQKKAAAKKPKEAGAAHKPVQPAPKITQLFSPAAIRALAFDGTGRFLVCVSDAPLLALYDLSAPADATKPLAAFTPLFRRPSAIVFTPDNRFVLVADRIGDVYAVPIAALRTGKPAAPRLLFSHGCVVTSLVFFKSSSGDDLLLSADQEHKTRVSQFPRFFTIERMLSGQKCMVTTADVFAAPAGAAAPFLLTTSSVAPTISNITPNGEIEHAGPTRAADLAVWEPLSGRRVAARTLAVAEFAPAGDAATASLTLFSSSARVAPEMVLLAPAAVVCTRAAGSTAFAAAKPSLGPLAALLAVAVAADGAIAEPAPAAVSVATTAGVSADALASAGIVAVTAMPGAAGKALALTDRNEVWVVSAVAPAAAATAATAATASVALDVTEAWTLPGAGAVPVSSAAFVISTAMEMHARLIDQYFKHEVIFANKQRNAEMKRTRKADKAADRAAANGAAKPLDGDDE
jgi:hypothetical protein